ncbi:MAG: SymE family type I addiction module toxin [Lachnospiraceae bacterium]|nr:SymE family type I addiction module toxin [Lachnospiraceae bacterium]
MIDKKKRNLKGYGQGGGYKYLEVPTIILRGKWLLAAGFDIGDYIFVVCEDGRLVITPDAERAKLAEAEAAFM